MPALPWMTTTPDVDPATEVTVMGSLLPLRSHRSIPRLLRWTVRIRRQLASSPGLVGYALDAHLVRKELWTVSAWTGRPELRRFDRADPHHAAVEDVRPAMAPTTFVTWTTTAGELPVAWDEVRRRVGEARDRRATGGRGGVAADPPPA